LEISRPIHSGIVDKDRKRLRLRDCLSRRVDVGHIQHQGFGLFAARADCGGGIVGLGFGSRGKNYMCARRGQRRSRRKSDAAPAASDQRALAVEAEGWGSCEFD
jgi:hypothetical protein